MVKSFIICEVKVEDLREENQKRETIGVSTGVPTGVVVVRILENEKDKKESLKLTRKIQVQVVRVKERETNLRLTLLLGKGDDVLPTFGYGIDGKHRPF